MDNKNEDENKLTTSIDNKNEGKNKLTYIKTQT